MEQMNHLKKMAKRFKINNKYHTTDPGSLEDVKQDKYKTNNT